MSVVEHEECFSRQSLHSFALPVGIAPVLEAWAIRSVEISSQVTPNGSSYTDLSDRLRSSEFLFIPVLQRAHAADSDLRSVTFGLKSHMLCGTGALPKRRLGFKFRLSLNR